MGYAISGGPYVFTSISGATKNAFLDGLLAALRAADWDLVSTTTAYCIGTFNDIPLEGRSVTLDGQSYTFYATINNSRAGDVLMGATVADCIANLTAAINRSAGAGTLYSSATPLHATLSATAGASTLTVTAKTAGPAGNNLACNNSGTFITSWRATEDAGSYLTAYGGYKLRGRSPQVGGARTVGLWIYDIANAVSAIVQFFSEVDAGIQGYRHPLRCAAGLAYQVIANPCQFFLSRPGVRADVDGSAVCGGVPFVTTDPCPEMNDGSVVDEIWWSMGDGRYNPFFWSSNPRGNLLTTEYNPAPPSLGTRACEGCLNGNYVTTPSGIGAPRILCLTGPSDIDQLEFLGQTFSSVRYWDDSSVDQEPLLAWGEGADSAPRIRGQAWDAVIRSTPADMDTLATFDEHEWINYTDNFFYGALYLITGGGPDAPGESDYTY